MAEVIGLLASVAQLAEYTLKACEYAHQIKGGPKEKEAIGREASVLFTLLHRLQRKIELAGNQDSPPSFVRLAQDQALKQTLEELTTLLKKLISMVEKPNSGLIARVRWPLDERECQKILQRIERLKASIQHILQENLSELVENGLTSMKLDITTLIDEQEERKWEKVKKLFPNARSYRRQHEIFESSLHGTGSWLLQHQDFNDWVDGTGGTLWCHGIPGAGKTIMASIIVNFLDEKFQGDSKVGVTCIYCDYNDPRSLFEILSDVYMQLLRHYKKVPSQVKSFIERSEIFEQRPTITDIKELIQSEVKTYSKLYVVTDALDECMSPTMNNETAEKRARLGKQVVEILQSVGAQVNLLVTSRVVGDLPKVFEKTPQLEISAHQEDVIAYIEQRIKDCHEESWARMCATDAAFKARVINTLTEKAHGMFLLVRLHIDALNEQRKVVQVERCLRSLPATLDTTYRGAMDRIDAQAGFHRSLARKVLTWVSFALRPLKIAELQHAEATTVGEPQFDERDVESAENLISYCAGLIVIDPNDHTVRFVHYSTQEYFQRSRYDHFPDGQNEITEVCLTYLSFENIENAKDSWDRDRCRDLFPLVGYSACCWGHHAREIPAFQNPAVKDDSDAVELALTFLARERRITDTFFTNPEWEDWESIPSPRVGPWQDRKEPHGLHVAAGFGLTTLLELLLGGVMTDLDRLDGFGFSPLYWAVAAGEENAVRYLVERGANVNTLAVHSITPLMAAAALGRLEIVEYLYQHSADINAMATGNLQESTALYEACFFGHLEVFRLLLHYGAKTTMGEDGKATETRWPMCIAAEHGKIPFIQLLLANGVSLQGENGYKALHRAIEHQQQEVVALLLNNGADPSFTPGDRYPGITTACFAGHVPIIENIIQKGIGADEWTPEIHMLAIASLSSMPWFEETSQYPIQRHVGDTGSTSSFIKFRRERESTYDQNSHPRNYMGLIVPDEVGAVEKIVFRAESHDQGWCDHPNAGSHTWFDASIHSSSRSDRGQHLLRQLFKNVQASYDWHIHERTWTRDDQDDGIATSLQAIRPGHVIQVMAHARFDGWVNFVRSFEVEIYFE